MFKIASSMHKRIENKIFEIFFVTFSENLCNVLRFCVMEENKGVRETLAQPSMLYQTHTMTKDVHKILLKNFLQKKFFFIVQVNTKNFFLLFRSIPKKFFNCLGQHQKIFLLFRSTPSTRSCIRPQWMTFKCGTSVSCGCAWNGRRPLRSSRNCRTPIRFGLKIFAIFHF